MIKKKSGKILLSCRETYWIRKKVYIIELYDAEAAVKCTDLPIVL